jgi:UDP:flavonoid glycosyltransferase YjiC (YdhE family)
MTHALQSRALPRREFVFVSKGSGGDVIPAIEAGKILAAKGHAVTLCAPSEFSVAAVASGLMHVTYEERPLELKPQERCDEGARAAAVQRHMERTAADEFDVLGEMIGRADVVAAFGTSMAASSLAEALGASYRFVGFCPQFLPSAEHPPMAFPVWRDRAGNLRQWEEYRRLGEDVARELDVHRVRVFGLGPMGEAFGHIHGLRSTPILCADSPMAPIPTDTVVATSVPAALGDQDGGLSGELEEFLAEGSPPVFVGFSLAAVPPSRGQMVLDAISRAGLRAVVSGGLCGLELPDTCVAVKKSEPHSALFARCSAVVSHGGAGTVTRAARIGVPQVAVWHFFDQEYWGRRIARLGIGPGTIPAHQLSVDNLSAALGELVGRPTYRTRAKSLARELLGNDGRVALALELEGS